MGRISRTGRNAVLILAVFAIAAAAFWFFAFRMLTNTKVYRQPSASMLPTLELNDLVRVDMAAYKDAPPRFGDLIVFTPPEYAMNSNQTNVEFIMRCIGGPGDLIEIRKGKLYRNGKETPEPYIRNTMDPTMDFRLVELDGSVIPLLTTVIGTNSLSNGTVEKYSFSTSEDQERALKLKAVPIPAGKILAMGDNRDNASDSRMWGLADLDKVVGKAAKL